MSIPCTARWNGTVTSAGKNSAWMAQSVQNMRVRRASENAMPAPLRGGALPAVTEISSGRGFRIIEAAPTNSSAAATPSEKLVCKTLR